MEIRTNVTEEGNIYGYWMLGPDTWCLTDHWRNFMYLLIGTKYAMLIDTGSGEGNIREVVEQITEKKIMVVNTHGHFDHTGGNSCWPEAWMTEEAALHAKQPFNSHYKDWFFQKPYPDYVIHTVRDGQIIDLGERQVEVLTIPAHSEGSIALLDRRMRSLFCGDEIESGQVIWFVRNEALSLKELALIHKRNMERLLKRHKELEYLWPAHNGAPLCSGIYLEAYQKLDEQIIKGIYREEKDTAGFGFPPDTREVSSLFADYGKLRRIRCGLASVIYSEERSVYHNG